MLKEQPFFAMDYKKFPHYIHDTTAELLSRKRCERACRKPDWESVFNEEISVRHHEMVIRLALGDKLDA